MNLEIQGPRVALESIYRINVALYEGRHQKFWYTPHLQLIKDRPSDPLSPLSLAEQKDG